ncbi:hypothetical protein PDJAM_G00163250 [Pangasius djambal]|uniref:Uncharacterized protein n=1 Tax=Pangasius djambal TaxID=1691987 RepID=A0ACC5ZKJ3_9TELE|nr:hypothetical protein [Pangasius djambal]
MDVVTSTAFSVDIDSLNNPKDPFVSNIKKMLKFDLLNPLFLAVALFPFIAPVLEKMDLAFFPTSVTDFFYASLQKIKSERVAKDHKKRVDLMQLMIDSQKSEKDDLNGKETNKGLNDHEILSQSMMFIFAGYETSSSTLSFLFYNLASNPETVKKLQEEIDETFSNKDTVVLIPTYALHRDTEYWTDPETFNPERFTQENKESIDPYTYMPFGLGPRNCIGMRFAIVAMKLAVVEILQRFDISLSEETKVPLKLSKTGLLAPEQPIKMIFTPRKMSNSCNNHINS